MTPEIIFSNSEGEVMRKPATLADVQAFLKETKGQIDGQDVTEIHATLSGSLDLLSIEFETE